MDQASPGQMAFDFGAGDYLAWIARPDAFPWDLARPYEALPWESDPLVHEVWRPILDFPGYDVSSFGRCRTYWGSGGTSQGKRGLTLTPRPMSPGLSHGYRLIRLSRDGSQQGFGVHTLVLASFVGPRPAGLQGCHGDGIPSNNRLDNLRWDTHHENAMDDLRNGGNRRYKLTPDDVRSIWSLALEGRTSSEISRIYPVKPGNIPHILSGRSWSTVTRDLPGFPLIKLDHREPVRVPPEIALSPVELWESIPDFPGYRVSIWGRVQTSKFQPKGEGIGRGRAGIGGEWKDMKPTDIGDHYDRYHFRRPGKTRFVPVHILILECFAGPRPPGMQACHGDGDRQHNRAANLRWDTVTGNARDRVLHRKLRGDSGDEIIGRTGGGVQEI